MGSIPTPLTSSQTGTFNFAFGSNLSPRQVRGRLRASVSSSIPVAIARLDGWKWIICQRGYANIVELPSNTHAIPDPDPDHSTVWGVVYNLSPADEHTLDGYEGHDDGRNPHPTPNPDPDEAAQRRRPYLQGNWDYNKHYLPVTVTKWLRDPEEYGLSNSTNLITVLAYVDELRTNEGRKIIPEYVGRMNRAIDEGVALGLPKKWADKVMRREGWVKAGIYPAENYFGQDGGYIEGEEEGDEVVVGTEAST